MNENLGMNETEDKVTACFGVTAAVAAAAAGGAGGAEGASS